MLNAILNDRWTLLLCMTISFFIVIGILAITEPYIYRFKRNRRLKRLARRIRNG